MAFVNLQVPLESLPEFSSVDFIDLHPRYARVVLGLALAFQVPAVLFVTVLLFAVAVPNAGLPLAFALLIFGLAVITLIFVSWFSYQASRVIRYAIRQHDVIVQSGVFWKKETVQPIRRVQHVEQLQGPIDKRFGLFELKLFSAGTGHFTFRIPGLGADAASRIRQFILDVQQDGWGDEAAAFAPAGSSAEVSGRPSSDEETVKVQPETGRPASRVESFMSGNERHD